jgi:hypothetical protein
VGVESWAGEIGELQVFAGDFSGGLILGDSRTTFVGVALTLNARCGESATLVGERVTGGLLIGDSAGAEFFAGDRVIMESFRGESSPGRSEMRLLRRRVDRLCICFSSIFKLASTGSGETGTSNAFKGCKSATMREPSFFGSIGQRVLCRFLGTHFKRSSSNVTGFVLVSFVVVAGSCSAAATMAGSAVLDAA